MSDSGNYTSIIIALVALLGSAIAAIVWTLKWAVEHYGEDIREHTKAAIDLANASKSLTKSSDRNSAANLEVLTFMKKLNGKLSKATIQTVQEQNVEHQTIQKQSKE